jgi:hypothetical protein
MATLQTRLSDLATRIGVEIKAMLPKLLPPGGTAGQVLAKSSGTDYATEWVDAGGEGGADYGLITSSPTASADYGDLS